MYYIQDTDSQKFFAKVNGVWSVFEYPTKLDGYVSPGDAECALAEVEHEFPSRELAYIWID